MAITASSARGMNVLIAVMEYYIQSGDYGAIDALLLVEFCYWFCW